MDVYAIVTEKILDLLSKKIVPWRSGWQSEGAKNLISQKEYQGINSLLLNAAVMDHKYPWFLTYQQAKQLGGYIKQGSKGYMVVYYSSFTVKDTDTINEEEETKWFLKYSTVFNLDQTEGIKLKSVKETRQIQLDNEKANNIISNWKKTVETVEGGKPCYVPFQDTIKLPPSQNFENQEIYYSVFFHEAVHSTGHSSRLDRFQPHTYFGDESYSKEELIAEVGAGFLNHIVGIGDSTINNNVSYISNWMQHLSNDNRLIVRASSAARKAVDLILKGVN